MSFRDDLSRLSRDPGAALARLRESDAVLVVGLLLGVYAAFIALGAALGYGVNGQLNSLRRITFLTAVYALVVMALNLHWGYTGLFNIGVAGFMAVGVYTTAMVTAAPDARVPGLGLPFGIGVVLGMVAAAIVGLIAALPALRLRADYLAIVTIAMAEIIRLSYLSPTLQEFEVAGVQMGTGGGGGISLSPTPDTYVVSLVSELPIVSAIYGAISAQLRELGVVQNVIDGWVYALFLLGCVVVFYWFLQRLGHSPFGRALKAIREDEDVARALGKNTRLFKIKSFMVGCALMGVVGILWIGSRGFIEPNSFLPQLTFYVWIALIIGGAGSNTGSIVGAGLFAAVLFEGPRYLRNVIDAAVSFDTVPNHSAAAVGALLGGDLLAPLAYALDNINALRLIFVGTVLIWLMQNRPQGLLGHRKDIAASVDLSRPERPEGSESGRATAADGGESK